MRGFLIFGIGWILLTGVVLAQDQTGTVRGRVVDGRSGEPVRGVAIRLYRERVEEKARGTLSDSSGWFEIDNLPFGDWNVQAEGLGYKSERLRVRVEKEIVEIEMQLIVQPLLMDEMLVRARREDGEERTPAFVEIIPLKEGQTGLSLPEVLDQAVGVKIRRNGGMGSFSTVSIRGSTAEQVEVYLDGVPLNQALGGGVNMGDLPVTGVQSIEVFRGAIPARFGGNSIGGVIHIRTRDPGNGQRMGLQGTVGSFGTRQLSASASGVWKSSEYLGLVDIVESRSDFRFWDDNGTEYNSKDDEWAKRINSDFRSFRTLTKVVRPWRVARLQLHNTFDLKHQGIPGIGNFQAAHVRSDMWRNITEMELFGTFASSGYRIAAYHLLQKEEYKDLEGEVGTGTQHDRNTTRSLGLRGELNSLLPRQVLFTAAGKVNYESFSPGDLFRDESRLLKSKRRSSSLALEIEVPLWRDLLQLMGGGQAEIDKDRFFDQKDFGPSRLLPNRDNTEVLWGWHWGGRVSLSENLALKGHLASYQRAPSFFELFGDRGAVLGNTDLVSEKGRNRDLGLVYRHSRTLGIQLIELIYYRKSVRDMIRFIQNSQRVSQPHNVGKARIQGVEARGQLSLFPVLRLNLGYVYQQALDRSPFSYHRDKDLPNAPRHVVNSRINLKRKKGEVYYELNRESRHFLDRANLRPIPSRLIHNAGGSRRLGKDAELSWEIRNLTSNQVADLWGYPLPGRSYFVSFRKSFRLSTKPFTQMED